MQKIQPDTRNAIFRALESGVYAEIFPHLSSVDLSIGDPIYRPNERMTHVYFPENGVISVVTYLSDGNCVETGVIGNEGVSGTEILLGQDRSPREAMVQLAGTFQKMRIEKFGGIVSKHASLKTLLFQYLSSFIFQISQNPACLAYHKVENRLARWLLMFHDRGGSDNLKLTQEFIAVMLGVHRPRVSQMAAELQRKGLIKYSRGNINIIDRTGLEQASCECYEDIKAAGTLISS
jgi:CRP-like cAMP-binding protein